MSNEENNEKLYAGKFKTIEELEKGYSNSAVVFDENEKLKKQVQESTTVPDVYQNPSDVELDQNRVKDLQARAKESGMTQAQYDKFVRSDKARVEANKARFDDARKEVGEETMNLLKDYVSKQYPPELADNMLNTFIGNKEARTAALKHRDQLLNNNIPGLGRVSTGGGYTVNSDDVRKAYEAKEKNPHDMKARARYIALCEQQAAQKAG